MTSRAERESLVAEAERIIRAGSKSLPLRQPAVRPADARAGLAALRLVPRLRRHGRRPGARPRRGRAGRSRGAGRAWRDADRPRAGRRDGRRSRLRRACASSLPNARFRAASSTTISPASRSTPTGWRPPTRTDLLRYCYHVAGAVGCMMAVHHGRVARRRGDAGPRRRSRHRLPARQYRPRHRRGSRRRPDLHPGDLARREGHRSRCARRAATSRALADFAARLAALAETYEASARIGAERLPRRSRWAVLSAANIYGHISRKVVARGEKAWDSRTVIGKWAKLAHVARALR